MPFRGVLVSRGMYMGVIIDQTTIDGYFPTQKDHLHLLEGVSKNICCNTTPYYYYANVYAWHCKRASVESMFPVYLATILKA